MTFLSQAEIEALAPEREPRRGRSALEIARAATRRLGIAGGNQQMGQRWAVGCVALEITQRCNLDCTLCYLSEHSEAVRDLPMEEIFRRIDRIRERYGANTDVQITGGEPTLRRREELAAIVSRVTACGLRATLMTNGIRASRGLLVELAARGLVDVAFHVDTTQQRRGYSDEPSLNVLRDRYLARARAAGLSVIFNTTVHAGNFEDIPDLVRFFRANAAHVRTAAFQLQADTGRGIWRERAPHIAIDTLIEKIREGAGARVRFDVSMIGHPRCSRYGLCAALGGRLVNLLDDPSLAARVQQATAHVVLDRRHAARSAARLAACLMASPRLLAACLAFLARKAWQEKAALLACSARPTTLSFTIHAFMDACRLERERIDACVFKVMTAEGPLSMCLHNAKRDRYILAPVALGDGPLGRLWDPLDGRRSVEVPPPAIPGSHPRSVKRLKGRARRRALGGGD